MSAADDDDAGGDGHAVETAKRGGFVGPSKLYSSNLARYFASVKMTKEQILKEIRRTAVANGGVPLGKRAFQTETGIKESDWSGIYWARWGDALLEAGLAPNKITSAYETPELLERTAHLAIELGRLPTRAEMKLKRRVDPSFPSLRPFGRLGSNAELHSMLVEFCRNHPRYAIVVEFSRNSETRSESTVAKDDGASVEDGFVYLIKSGRYYKIGRSNAPGRREREIQLQLPEKLKMIHTIRTDDPAGIEAYWHTRFEQKRKGGEWFDLSAADVAYFKRRKFM